MGIEIHKDRSRIMLGLSQGVYIDCVIKRFNMSNCSPGDAPTVKGDKFSKFLVTYIRKRQQNKSSMHLQSGA